jgi:hypothetical protein
MTGYSPYETHHQSVGLQEVTAHRDEAESPRDPSTAILAPGETAPPDNEEPTQDAAEAHDETEEDPGSGQDIVSDGPAGESAEDLIEEPIVEEVARSDAEPSGATAVGEESDDTITTDSEDEPGVPDTEPEDRSDTPAPEHETTDETAPPATDSATTADDRSDTPDGNPQDEAAEETTPPAADEATGADPIDQLIDDEAAGRFRARWHDVKAAFVDDPADALRQAGALSGEVMGELANALERLQQTLDEHNRSCADADTENMRIAVRRYGSMIERLLI